MSDELPGQKMAEEVRGMRVETDREVSDSEKEADVETDVQSAEGHSDFVAGTDSDV